MRRALFRIHLALARSTGLLLLAWSLSGLVMLAAPLLQTALPSPRPDLPPPPALDATGLLSPSALPLPNQIRSLQLRSFEGARWYEVTDHEGSRSAWDAARGHPVAPYLDEARLCAWLDRQLAGSAWRRSARPTWLEAHDDHYRRGDLPVWRVPLEGPGGWWLYLGAQDARVEKATDSRERLMRWLGMGAHTWNLRWIKERADPWRRLALCALVALPLAGMAGLSLWLLQLREQTRGTSSRSPAAPSPHRALDPGP